MSADAFTWAGRIKVGAVAELGNLRLVHGLEAAQVAHDLWVRGPKLRPSDEEMVRRAPWEERYEVIGKGLLRRAGRILPEGEFPQCAWSPLGALLHVRLPVSAASSRRTAGVQIELRPEAAVREPNLIEAATQDWIAYVEIAPEIRLHRLAFVVNGNEPGRVLIRGLPLPPLPGRHFVEADHIAVPAGFRWYPPVSAESVRASLGAVETEIVILWPDDGWSRVPRSAWIPAARSTVRLMLSSTRYAH